MYQKILHSTPKLDFRDVLIVPKSSFIDSRKLVNLNTTVKFRYSRQEWHGTPIISSNMDTVTNLNTMDILAERGWLSCFPKHFNAEWAAKDAPIPEQLKKVDSYILSTGINKKDMETLDNLMDKLEDGGITPKFICVDVANGYLNKLTLTCASIRDKYPHITLIAGNVVTPTAVEDLILAGGVDVVKIGIGSSSVCTTRKMTGVGYPQLSAILDCELYAKSLHAHVISDGGVTCPADIAKAFCAGATFVMLGSYLAAHDESPGETINGEKLLYGMSSSIANEKYNGGLQNYKASEGRVVRLKQRGPINKTLQEIEGGIRSCCTYINAKKINDMQTNSRFILVNNQLERLLEPWAIGS